MKTFILTFSLLCSVYSFSQSNECNIVQQKQNEKISCTLKLSKSELLKSSLSFKCSDETIALSNFKLKFSHRPTITVKDSNLTPKGEKLMNALKSGDHIILFGIKEAIVNGNSKVFKSPFSIGITVN